MGLCMVYTYNALASFVAGPSENLREKFWNAARRGDNLMNHSTRGVACVPGDPQFEKTRAAACVLGAGLASSVYADLVTSHSMYNGGAGYVRVAMFIPNGCYSDDGYLHYPGAF